ncbi:MAG: potassium channel protein [Bacteriovoracaceae bacterium]|nr:potassium channel protein [Bacteriovoracaceae bacterium]
MINTLRTFITILNNIRHKVLFRIGSFLMGIFVFGSASIYYFEHTKNAGLKNFLDVLYFMVTTMSTVGFGDKVVVTVGGKIVVILAILLTIGALAAFSAVAATFFIEIKIREEMGMAHISQKDHTVIIGWNKKGPKILDMVSKREKRQVIIVAPLERKPVRFAWVSFVRGSHPVSTQDLVHASVENAASIILLADYSMKIHSDAMTAINCLLARKLNPKAKIISELLDPTSKEYLEKAGCDHIVGVGEVGGALLAATYLGEKKLTSFWDEIASM